MLVRLATALLAARDRELDTPQLVLYGVLLLASIVGGILQKRKADTQKSPTGKPPAKPTPHRTVSRRTGRPTVLTQQPPTDAVRRPARPAAPPRVARPARLPGEVGVPAPQPVRPVAVRPPSGLPAELPGERRRPAAEPPTEPPRPAVSVAATATRLPPAPQVELAGAEAVRARVQAALRDRSQLQAVLVLSELLAPPLALRDPW